MKYLCRWSVFILLFVSIINARNLRERQNEDLEFAKRNYVMKSQAFSAAERKKACGLILPSTVTAFGTSIRA